MIKLKNICIVSILTFLMGVIGLYTGRNLKEQKQVPFVLQKPLYIGTTRLSTNTSKYYLPKGTILYLSFSLPEGRDFFKVYVDICRASKKNNHKKINGDRIIQRITPRDNH